MSPIWMSNISSFYFNCWFYLHHCYSLSMGLQQVNIISVMHNIVSKSICLFVIFKLLCTSLWWWLSCYGSPAGHLTPSQSFTPMRFDPKCVSMWDSMGPPCCPYAAEWWFPVVERESRGWQQASRSGRTPVVCETVTPASCAKAWLSPLCTMEKMSTICVFTTSITCLKNVLIVLDVLFLMLIYCIWSQWQFFHLILI